MAENHTSDTNQIVTNEDQSTQNDYIIVINKKIRALKKKCQNIAYIEKKLVAKEEINPDQKKLVETKDQIIKSLNEFEALRNQFVEIYDAEQKGGKDTTTQTNGEQKQDDQSISAVVTLLHTSHVFDRTRGEGVDARNSFFTEIAGKPNVTVKADADIDNIYYLITAIFANNLNSAIDISQKYANASEEEFAPGVPFKYLKNVVADLAASSEFAKHHVGYDQKVEQAQHNETQQQEQVNATPQPLAEYLAEKKQEVQPENQNNAEQSVDQIDGPAQENEENVEENGEEGFQTTEGRRGRGGRGRGSRGNRGRGSRGGQRGTRGRGGFENRDNRDNRDKDNRVPREGKSYDNRSPRGGRDFDKVPRGGRGQQQKV